MESIFRKKSLERVKSPEELNTYIKIVNPGIILILSAVFTVLLGILVWGCFGTIDTYKTTVGILQSGQLSILISDTDIESISYGDTLEIGEDEYRIEGFSDTPVKLDGENAEYLLYLGGYTEDQWFYIAYCDAALPEGYYKVSIRTESIKPMSFLFEKFR